MRSKERVHPSKFYEEKFKRVHIFVSGRVQGVFFRENTKRKAEELRIAGWVKNLTDGRVEAILEGEKEKIDKLIDWAKTGPTFAKVDKVEITPEECQDEFEKFEIKYN